MGSAIRCVTTVGLALGALMVAAPAPAQQPQNAARCENKGSAFTPDLAISGCTAVIQSGKESRKNLAIAFYDRGVAFESKKDHDRAIADYKAIGDFRFP